MSRQWCPAIAADAEVTFDREHIPRSQSPAGGDVKPKLIGAQAADLCLASIKKVNETAARMAASPPSKFSARVAVSTESVTGGASNESGYAIAPEQPTVDVVPRLPDEVEATKPMPKKLVVRSVAHADVLAQSAVKGLDLSRVDATTEELLQFLQHRQPLESLRVRHSIRGTLGACELMKSAGTWGGLRALDIGFNPTVFSIGEEPNNMAADEAVKLLSSCGSLNALGLACTGLGAVSATVLPALRNHSGITSLDLSRNGLGLQQDEAAVSALAQLIQENKFLLRLDLSHNDMAAPLAKQLFDALQASDTRVKTPEAEAEPEAEEYTDDVPPEEEAPQVTVGFPEDAAPASVDEEKPAENVDAPPEPASSPPPPGDLDTTEEPKDTEEEVAAETLPDEVAAAEELDPEAAEAARLEAEEKAAEELNRRKEEWEARMKQYIWEPEQVLFVFKESVARRELIAEYVRDTLDAKKVEKVGKKESKDAQLQRERRDRDRRSGWSHLQEIALSGNAIGSIGAKALASAIRHEIPLATEELQAKEEEAAKVLEERRNAAREERRKERAAAAAAAKKAARTAEATEAQETLAEVIASPTEGDEEAEPTPAADVDVENVTVEDDAIPAPSGDAVADNNDAADDAEGGDTAEDIDVSDIVAAPVLATKPGLCTVRALHLDQCSIGSSGLKCLATAVASECPSLEFLSLRKNKFGSKKQSVPAPNPLQGDEEEKPTDEAAEGDAQAMMKVDMPTWVSPGITALSTALTTCTSLATLDLSYNNLYPKSIRTLASGLRENKSLLWLGLNGNRIGVEEADAAGLSACAVLLEAVANQGCIHTLLLSSCELTQLGETEFTLLSTTPNLKTLSLGFNQISNEQVDLWGKVIQDLSDDSPRSSLQALYVDNNLALSGSEGGAALGRLLRKHSELHTVSVGGCYNLRDEGVERLVAAISTLRSLTRVSLHRCNAVASLEMVATALSQLPQLRVVDVGDNEAPMEAFRGLAASLAEDAARPLEALTLWSRLSDSEELLPSLVTLTQKVHSVVMCDVGIPFVFKNTRPSTAAAAGDVDIFEELERAALANRVSLM